MRDEFRPAIEALQKDLANAERKANEIRRAINTLCEHAGDKPIYPEVDKPAEAVITSIQADTFYGKRLGTAAREYLEMRRASNLGPAKPREIFEALRQGGYQFEAKDEQTALVSLRATLRKSSATFHKLPNGEYGLLSWYPDAKVPRSSPDDDGDEEDDENETADAKKKNASAV